MRVQFQNHSSLLIHYADKYLLTDPWYDQPAFGSWLPSLPPYLHPSYLAALGDKLTILISHGHDDHFDDRLLSIFNPDTKIVTAEFRAPSVLNRIKRLGFKNVVTVNEQEEQIDGLLISSFIVPELSHDDAVYLIRNDDGAVIHANDNWHEFTPEHKVLIKSRTDMYEKNSILLFSQTNSASGFPLAYRIFDQRQKEEILNKKLAEMLAGAIANSKHLGIDRFFSYAGFATIYVKNKTYEEQGVFPSASLLMKIIEKFKLSTDIDIPHFFPGDYIELPAGSIVSAFVSKYSPEDILTATDKFYNTYGNIDQCLSYKTQVKPIGIDSFESWLEYFLVEFDLFVRKRVNNQDQHHSSIIGKVFSIDVAMESGANVRKSVEFGTGPIKWKAKANKICYVQEAIIQCVLDGTELFESLYTGYNAEWERYPHEIYNRDIVSMIIMFSYVYKNRIAEQLVKKFTKRISVDS